MPRVKRGDEEMRYEAGQAFTEEEETFSAEVNPGADERASSIIYTGAKRGKKGKRSVEDMMASMATPEAQALYAMERIASAEDQIDKVFALAMPETREIILKRRPSLRRYAEPHMKTNE